jgi:ABC-type polysaccharide/polyol phosphate transport system ATPase subunit
MRLRLGSTTALMTRVDILLIDEVLEAYRNFIIS